MMKRRVLTMLMALATALMVNTIAAQRPSHGDAPVPPVSLASPVAVEVYSCRDIETYYNDLDAALANEGPFLDFFFSDISYEALDRADGPEIIAHGEEIVGDLRTIDAPEPYAPAHEGIVLFLTNIVDFVSFYTIDSSTVPDVYAIDEAMALIYEGEVAIVEACPAEIERLGGYLFFDPATLEDQYGPDQ